MNPDRTNSTGSSQADLESQALRNAVIEIERKWVVDPQHLPAYLEQQAEHIFETMQGYLALEQGGNEVRVRKANESFYLTIKSIGTLSRREGEIEISAEQFDELWPLTEGRRIEKTRYSIPCGDGIHTIDIDVFHGQLQGLVLAEVEFASEAESQQFSAPDWLGEDVTKDSRYKNRNLALNGIT